MVGKMESILLSLQSYTNVRSLLSFCITCKSLYSLYSNANHTYGGYRLSKLQVNIAVRLLRKSALLIGNVYDVTYVLMYSLYNIGGTTAVVNLTSGWNNSMASSILDIWLQSCKLIKATAPLPSFDRLVILDLDGAGDIRTLTRLLSLTTTPVFYLSNKVDTYINSILSTYIRSLSMARLGDLNPTAVTVINLQSVPDIPNNLINNVREYMEVARNIYRGVNYTIQLGECADRINAIVPNCVSASINVLPLQYYIATTLNASLVIIDVPNVLIYTNHYIVSYNNLINVLPYITNYDKIYIIVWMHSIEEIKQIIRIQSSLLNIDTVLLHVINLQRILQS